MKMEASVVQSIRRVRAAACYGIGLLTACVGSHPPASATPSAGPPATSIDVFVPASSVRDRSIRLADFQPDLAAVDGPFECTGRNPIGQSSVGREIVGPDAVSISAAFPSRAETMATVVVIVDSAGKIIRYAERRGPAIHPVVPGGVEAGASPAQVAAAAASVRSTIITLDYVQHRGSVANRGGGRPDQTASGPADVVGLMENLGKPLDRAARVLTQCKGS